MRKRKRLRRIFLEIPLLQIPPAPHALMINTTTPRNLPYIPFLQIWTSHNKPAPVVVFPLAPAYAINAAGASIIQSKSDNTYSNRDICKCKVCKFETKDQEAFKGKHEFVCETCKESMNTTGWRRRRKVRSMSTRRMRPVLFWKSKLWRGREGMGSGTRVDRESLRNYGRRRMKQPTSFWRETMWVQQGAQVRAPATTPPISKIQLLPPPISVLHARGWRSCCDW